MAIYHMSVQTIARSKGGNAVAAAAYRAGERIEKYDYSRKSAVDFKAIYAPQNAPEWTTNRAELWAAVEQVEKRKDAQLCREINMALPVELKPEERVALLKEYAHTFVQLGMVADVAIHQQTGHNPHAHMMLTMRELTADGFGGKSRDWNRRELLEEWRESWATLTNQALERAGHGQRVDHRSLAAQGIDREPTKHQGKASTWIDRTKEPSLRVELNHRLADLAKSQAEVKAIQASLVQLEQTPEPKTPQVTAARIRQDTPRPTPTPTPPAAQVQPKHDIEPQPPLRGAELLPRIKELQEALTAAEEKKARFSLNWHDAKAKTASIQREIDEHNRAAKEGGVLKKIFGAGKVNAAADALLERYEAAQRLEAAAAAACKVGTALVEDTRFQLEQAFKDYAASPHGKDAAERAKQEREQKLQQDREKREQKKTERALTRSSGWSR